MVNHAWCTPPHQVLHVSVSRARWSPPPAGMWPRWTWDGEATGADACIHDPRRWWSGHHRIVRSFGAGQWPGRCDTHIIWMVVTPLTDSHIRTCIDLRVWICAIHGGLFHWSVNSEQTFLHPSIVSAHLCLPQASWQQNIRPSGLRAASGVASWRPIQHQLRVVCSHLRFFQSQFARALECQEKSGWVPISIC